MSIADLNKAKDLFKGSVFEQALNNLLSKIDVEAEPFEVQQGEPYSDDRLNSRFLELVTYMDEDKEEVAEVFREEIRPIRYVLRDLDDCDDFFIDYYTEYELIEEAKRRRQDYIDHNNYEDSPEITSIEIAIAFLQDVMDYEITPIY